MKPYRYVGEAELTCEISEDDIILLKMSGDVGNPTLDAFVEWGEKVKEAMRFLYNKNPDRVLTLIDASKVHEIDSETVSELYDLMRYNDKFVTRTAVFGANYFTRIIVELAIHITKRKNMKIFKTREEAMEYLLEVDEINKNDK